MKTAIVTCSVMAAVVIILVAAFTPIFYVYDGDETIDVFIIDGQSNAAYKNENGSVDLDVVNESLGTPSYDLYYYGNSTRPTMYSDSDTDYAIRDIYTEGSYVVGGLVAPFAYYISEAQHRDILVLDVGISAQSITNLIPGSTGGDWKIGVITAALNSISGYDHINMLGWAWLQGESDKTMAIDTYIQYFDDLEDYYASIGCKNCYIVKTRYIAGGNATIAQNSLIASNPSIHMGTDITDTFTGTDYMLDGLHYSQAARIIIAEEVTKVIPVQQNIEWGSSADLLKIIPLLMVIALLIGMTVIILRSRSNN